jgi:hypothetical protein
MIVEQTIEIPADRRITVNLPGDVPTGEARVKLSIMHKTKSAEKPLKMSRQMRKMMKLYGCLKDSSAFEGNAVDIQRQMRSEWDRPWDNDKHE